MNSFTSLVTLLMTIFCSNAVMADWHLRCHSLLALPNQAAIEYVSQREPVTKQDGEFLFKLAYAVFTERIASGSFIFFMKSGSTVLREPWDALEHMYGGDPSSVLDAKFVTPSGQWIDVFPLVDFIKTIIPSPNSDSFSRNTSSLGGFWQEIENHFSVARLLEPVQNSFSRRMSTTSIWKTLQTLPEEDLRSFLLQLSAQSGHRTHLLSKLRPEVGLRMNLPFFPEAGNRFSLPVFAVKKDLIAVSSIDSTVEPLTQLDEYFPGFVSSWRDALRKKEENPDTFFPMLIHPLQEQVLSSSLERHINQGALIKLGLELDPFMPTMSFRTLAYTGSSKVRIKLPISVQMTSVTRDHDPRRVHAGPILTQVVSEALRRSGMFEESLIVGETLGISLKHGTDKKLESGLNMFFREDPLANLTDSSALPIELASLFERSNRQATLIEEIMAEKGIHTSRDAMRFFEGYSHLVLRDTLLPFLLLGISFEAHQQNTFALFDLETADFKGLRHQDLAGGTKLYEPIFRIVYPEYEKAGARLNIALFDLPETLGQFIHTTLSSHLLPVAVLISKKFAVTRESVIETLRSRIEDVFKIASGKTASLAKDQREIMTYDNFHAQVKKAILEDPYPIRALLRMRLQKMEESQRTMIENPFQSASLASKQDRPHD